MYFYHPPKYLVELRRLATEYGCLLMFDKGT